MIGERAVVDEAERLQLRGIVLTHCAAIPLCNVANGYNSEVENHSRRVRQLTDVARPGRLVRFMPKNEPALRERAAWRLSDAGHWCMSRRSRWPASETLNKLGLRTATELGPFIPPHSGLAVKAPA